MSEQDLTQVNELETPGTMVILPIPAAINALAPNCRWSLVGFTYEDLEWEDDPLKKPTKEAVESKAQEILAEVPWNRLRRERDRRMKEVDWVTLRSVRTGEPIPQEWKDYMQALADITTTAAPIMVDGELINVTWPNRPDGRPAEPYRGS
jgi:hypothetical protein